MWTVGRRAVLLLCYAQTFFYAFGMFHLGVNFASHCAKLHPVGECVDLGHVGLFQTAYVWMLQEYNFLLLALTVYGIYSNSGSRRTWGSIRIALLANAWACFGDFVIIMVNQSIATAGVRLSPSSQDPPATPWKRMLPNLVLGLLHLGCFVFMDVKPYIDGYKSRRRDMQKQE